MRINMQINLKTVILLSTGLAMLLNVVSFLGHYPKNKDAFLTSWAYADTAAPAVASPTPGPARLSLIPAAPSDPTVTTAASSAQPTADSGVVAAALSRAGFSPEFAPLYLAVQRSTGTPWQLLAAVHRVETGQSGNTSRRSSAGASGPMQFMPATFAHYAADGDGNGTRDINDVDDAMLTAGRYLSANGARTGNYTGALYQYNHSSSYVSTVRALAARLGL
jgi:soluble lytic murein transglycosylase-like protein